MQGRSVAVVVSKDLFDQLSGHTDSLVDFMRRSPLYGSEDVTFERDRSLTREVEF